MGEKLVLLEPFYPDRMASRILGMGDVLTLIDKASALVDEQRAAELWQKVEADIDSTAETIHNLDTGRERGYSRALFVSNLFGRISTYAKNGNVEIVERAVARVREWNAKCSKPIITERHSLFKLPDEARSVRQKAEETASRENKEVAFEGGKVVWNYEADRLQILFDAIPSEEVRSKLKMRAFKWSPRFQAWQRQLTDNAVHAARMVLGLNNL